MAVCAVATHIMMGYATSVPPKQSNGSHHKGSSNWVALLLGDESLLRPTALDAAGVRAVYGFSIIFSLNIAVGNVSLQYVSVNFNQVLRSLVPVLILWAEVYVLRGKTISQRRQWAVWPVVLGVALAYAGDRWTVTFIGVVSTLLCVLLAALKVIVSSQLLTGSLKMHPLELLGYMAPAALVQCLFLSFVTGEMATIRQRLDLNPLTGNWKASFVLIVSGILAFLLNISALQAYKLTSPLTACIASSVKNVLMIVLGTILFHTTVTLLNGAGILIVLAGSSYYSYLATTEQVESTKFDESDDNNSEQDDAVTDDETRMEDVSLLSRTIKMDREGTVLQRRNEDASNV
jgi:drug/metabolite transporter (DMT)-like permease